MKDSHTGAFAIICCGLYLRCSSPPGARRRSRAGRPGAGPGAGLLPRLLRPLAVTLPNARGTGLLATFTGPMDAVKARGVLAAWAVLTGGAMVAADVRTGLAALAGAGLACVYYVVTARRQFGGVTGDLAGFFLQLCELGMVLCAAVGQRLEVLL
ncbi:MAG: adenosylcobinamide-GDP ribazoletransferase [Flavonifractor plautii]